MAWKKGGKGSRNKEFLLTRTTQVAYIIFVRVVCIG